MAVQVANHEAAGPSLVEAQAANHAAVERLAGAQAANHAAAESSLVPAQVAGHEAAVHPVLALGLVLAQAAEL